MNATEDPGAEPAITQAELAAQLARFQGETIRHPEGLARRLIEGARLARDGQQAKHRPDKGFASYWPRQHMKGAHRAAS